MDSLQKKSRKSHDHNFKNLVKDFPKETLDLMMPAKLTALGPIKSYTFLDQEPLKDMLSDPHRALDLPILFEFEKRKIL